jgi:hypothetical protein
MLQDPSDYQALLARSQQILDRCYKARVANYLLRSKRHQLQMELRTEFEYIKLLRELDQLERQD